MGRQHEAGSGLQHVGLLCAVVVAPRNQVGHIHITKGHNTVGVCVCVCVCVGGYDKTQQYYMYYMYAICYWDLMFCQMPAGTNDGPQSQPKSDCILRTKFLLEKLK